jgi:hypothetical protein
MRVGIAARLRHKEELIWLLPVAFVAFALFLFAWWMAAGQGIDAPDILAGYFGKVLRALPLLAELLLLGLVVRAALKRSSSPIGDAAELVGRRFGSPMLGLGGAAPLLLMPVMFAGFGILKMLIPLYAPFAWDDGFAAADKALFLGRQPWTITHALFGSAGATVAIDRIYSLWVFLLSVAIVGYSLFAPRYDRARFFLAFAGAWLLLGVGGAYLFSSAGPCYSALIGASSGPEYAALIERLHAHSEPLGAVDWQTMLWEAHAGRRYGFGLGISAMPSLHNAVAVLYALALSRHGLAPRVGGWAFAAAIWIGSIHLGWHYAVDGIVAAAAMAGIWWAAGFYLAKSGYAEAVRAPAPAQAGVEVEVDEISFARRRSVNQIATSEIS